MDQWQARGSEPLSDYAIAMLQCAGYINRTYCYGQTEQTVAATVVLGPPGLIWGHTPEGCYPDHLYVIEQPARRLQFRPDERPDESFWLVTFRPRNQPRRLLHVVYAWSDGGPWVAPDSPRFVFGGRDFLYKLQVAAYASDDPFNDAEICRQFMEVFLPIADRHLVQAGEIWKPPALIPTATSGRTHTAYGQLAHAPSPLAFPGSPIGRGIVSANLK
jgi:hypothetical protein